MITYFIKSGICLALLLIFYHLVLEREKMHQFNRFYLLGSVLFSFLAPLFIIYTKVPVQIIETLQVAANESFVLETTETVDNPIDYWSYMVYLSIFISSILVIRFTRNILSIYQKTKKNVTVKHQKATLILVDDAISPHTFWNYIFINKDEYYSQKIEEELFTHELTHAIQKHTLDVLIIEVLKIIFWFNPIFYFLKRTVQLNHEFIADTKVISNHKNISEYQYLLLNKTAWNNEYYLASNLNYLLTKKRLLMMTKQSSRTKILFKKLAVIPVIAGFIFLFAERVEAKISDTNLDSFTVKELNTPLPSSTIIKEENKIPILKIDSKTNKYYFNNRLIELKDLKKEFLKATGSKKSNLKIDNKGKILFSFIKSIQKELSKEYLNEILLINNESYIYDDGMNLKTSTIKYYSPKNKDSLPNNYLTSRKIINFKKGTITYTAKDGKVISKKFSELTEEEMKMIPPPPPPISLKKKTLSSELFRELKNVKKYAVWIDGKAINNDALNNYKNTNFYNYSGSSVHKNARSKRFPQEYQYQLNTNNYIKELKKRLPPPPPKSKTKILVPPPPKTGFYESNGKKLYYVQKGKSFTFYNKYGQVVTKEGEIINPEQTESTNVIPSQNIIKVYKDSKVVARFKKTNLPPPPPKGNFTKVKKGDISNIPPPAPKVKKRTVSNIPPPPPPMSAKELVFKYPSATFYFNNKKVSHKKVSKLVKNKRRLSVLTQDIDNKKVIKFTTKDQVEKRK